jgi:hypothetical protein
MADYDTLDEFESWARNADALSPYAHSLIEWAAGEIRSLRAELITALDPPQRPDPETEGS